MPTLQVFINNKWEYVFCRNSKFEFPIVTDSQSMAIEGNVNSLNDFKKTFNGFNFRVSNIKI